MHHHRTSTHRKSKVIMGVLVGVLLCYWFMFSYFVSSDDVDVPAVDPSRTEEISIPTKRTPLGETKERTSNSDSDIPQKRSGPSSAISVEFSLAQIERSEEERERKCVKELCHQQCDPLCDQLPQKVKECSQVCAIPFLCHSGCVFPLRSRRVSQAKTGSFMKRNLNIHCSMWICPNSLITMTDSFS